jgi:SAM-dependent methyltransferase
VIKLNNALRFYNNFYNFLFKKLNHIEIDKNESIDLVKKNIKFLNHSSGLQTVWLLNLKKLIDLTKKNLDIENYHFLDVGCGNGIPLIYAYKTSFFKTYSGFDFISDYINIAKKNISNSIKTKKREKGWKGGNSHLILFYANAAEYMLQNKSYFIFMFNPFDGIIMKKFIKNNYKNLVKNKSVIAYSNYNQLNVIKNFTKNIQRIDKLKLAVCYF